MMTGLVSKYLHRLYDLGVGIYGWINSYLSVVYPLNPLVLRIRITKNCNFRCSFCFQSNSLNPGEKGHLTIDEWKKVVDRLPRHTILDVTGGEPFVAKNFQPLMDYFLTKGHRISLVTNGSFYNEEILNMFVEKKLYYLMFSVEDVGLSHDEMRGHKKSYEKIMKNLEAIKRIKKEKNSKFPLIGIKTMISDTNWKNLLNLHEECVNLGMINHHSLNLLKQNPVRGGNEVYKDDSNAEIFKSGNTAKYETPGDQLADQVHRLIKRSKETKIPVSFKPNIELDQLKDYFNDPSKFGVKACNKINSVITMYYDGSLAPCDIGIDIGNIREHNYDLKKVWRNQKFREYEKKLKSQFPYPVECEGCCLATHTAKAT